MLKFKNNKSKGFTIIEVLIVLAIAALILLIVFLAVPQLNNNFHDYQRKQDAAKIKTILLQYYTDHQSDPWPFPGGYTNNNFCFFTASDGYYFDYGNNINVPLDFPQSLFTGPWAGGYTCDNTQDYAANWFKSNTIPSMSYYNNIKYYVYASYYNQPAATITISQVKSDHIQIQTGSKCIDNKTYAAANMTLGNYSLIIFYNLSSGISQCLNVLG